MSFIAPHFNLPFRLRQSAECVEQDTIDDITNAVMLVLRTHLGTRPEAPLVGISDYTFKLQPIDKDALRDEIISVEPRAIVFIDSYPDRFDELIDHINIQIQTGGGQ